MKSSYEQLIHHIDKYVALKNVSGVSFDNGAAILRRFAKHCEPFISDELEITKEMVQSWIAPLSYESPNNRRIRTNHLVNFLKYLAVNGVKAYISAPIRGKQLPYVPYIFTNDELVRLFHSADYASDKPRTKHGIFSTRPLVMSIIFKLIYSCGLRVSEAVNLLNRDVDLDHGILTVFQTKLGKDRLVPIHINLLKDISIYAAKVNRSTERDAPFFPNPLGRKYDISTIYTAFREYLWDARISHGGRGHGPRIHDLRHTFAVHCLRQWVLDGTDLTTALPYLAAYMGHVGIESSQYYLRLTADMYPDIVIKMEKSFDVLPDLEVVYEAD